MREQNRDDNEGVTNKLCCLTQPSSPHKLSIPQLEQRLPSTAGPKMTALFYKLKFVFLPYWIVELFKYIVFFCETNCAGMFTKYGKRNNHEGDDLGNVSFSSQKSRMNLKSSSLNWELESKGWGWAPLGYVGATCSSHISDNWVLMPCHRSIGVPVAAVSPNVGAQSQRRLRTRGTNWPKLTGRQQGLSLL